MADDTWLYGYLGDAYDDTTEDQRARILAAQAAIERRWPEPGSPRCRHTAPRPGGRN